MDARFVARSPSSRPAADSRKAMLSPDENSDADDAHAPVTVTVQRLHVAPDIVLFGGVLSPSESLHLRTVFEPFLRRSATFSGGADSRRTSWSAFTTNVPGDPVVRKLVDRCAMLSGYPVSHVEPPQLVRYLGGEQYMQHTDNYAKDSPSYVASGQRRYTFFVYLTEADPLDARQTGGETDFPLVPFRVKALAGSAIFWRNADLVTGADLPEFHHAGLPPRGWVKWGANVWVRDKPWCG